MKKAGREARKIPWARRSWNPTLFAKCAKRMGHPAAGLMVCLFRIIGSSDPEWNNGQWGLGLGAVRNWIGLTKASTFEQREAAASKVDDELSSTRSRVSFPNLDLLLRLRPEVRL
jgi:hypothetical protein